MTDAVLDVLYVASVWVVPIVIAITFHEAAHGWVADRLGDDTARRMGRVTFNPIRHVDPFGTIVLPGLLLLLTNFVFGYAKPVPVNFARLNRPRRDMVWVALAGPGINFGLAAVSAWLLRFADLLPDAAQRWVELTLVASILINVILAIFNLLPLPPLDGGRVAVGLLPPALARPLARLERWGILIVVGAVFLLPLIGAQLGVGLHVFYWIVWVPSIFAIEGIAAIVGLDEAIILRVIGTLFGLS